MNFRDAPSPNLEQAQHTRELLDLLDVVEKQEGVTQRRLAERIGVAVGLANALVRRAVRKGFIKVSQAPVRRYAYYVTPEGFAEKSRLVAEYLYVSLGFFRRARREYLDLFEYCGHRRWQKVMLAGSGELAEIALLAAHAANIEIVGIIDPEANRDRLMRLPVFRSLAEAPTGADAVVITNARKPFECYEALSAELVAERVLAPPLLRLRRSKSPRS